MNPSCNRLWEIDPYREGRLSASAAESFDRHLRVCVDCRTQMERDEKLRELARRLPDRVPGELAFRRLRARLLRDAAFGVRAPSLWRLRLGIVAILVALGFASWGLAAPHFAPRVAVATHRASTEPTLRQTVAPGPDSEPLAGSVVGAGGARWAQTRERGVERVRLDDGSIRVHVRRQVGGERFLVILPDGEIEVRGTTFDVGVEHGSTTHVSVEEGVVELRTRDLGTTRLEAGDTWSPPRPPPPPPTAAHESPHPVPGPVTRSPVAPPASGNDDGIAAYFAAVNLLRDGHEDKAASAFHALVLAQPGTPQAEDASFLEAVALARLGRVDAAALAAEQHLAAYPASFHRKEAAILMARAASRRGDCDKARAILAPWKDDSLDSDAHRALAPCEGASR